MVKRKNPFDGNLHHEYSHYCYTRNGELYMPAESNISPSLTQRVHEQLLETIVEADYVCVGAQAAFNQEAYRFGIYPTLGTEECAHGLARDLYLFLQDEEEIESEFTSFLAVFRAPRETSEEEFEQLLWRQLLQLSKVDRAFHEWGDAVSPDPASPTFGFSFAERSFFVVGMHSNSSRLARRFPHPVLVFNQHAQFEALRDQEHFQRMKEVIREREIALQGDVNPMLADFGTTSEARQYSGRVVGPDWRCPVHFERDQSTANEEEPTHEKEPVPS